MFSLVVILAGMLLVVLESTLLVKIPAWFGRPDLVFVLVFWLALRFDRLRELVLAAVLGLLVGTVSGPAAGVYPASYLAVFVMVRTAAAYLNIDRKRYHAALLAAAYLLFFAAVWLAALLAGKETIPWGRAIPEIMALTVIAYPLVHTFDRWLAPIDDRETRRRRSRGRRRPNPYL